MQILHTSLNRRHPEGHILKRKHFNYIPNVGLWIFLQLLWYHLEGKWKNGK